MWTPRRLVLIVFGVALFSGGFTLYAQLFGWIDGLPPLPDAYAKPGIDSPIRDNGPNVVPPLIAKLRLAFGPDCVEQTYKLKFESRDKGLVFAATEMEFLPDGRMQLQQVSVAIFGKSNRDELSTIHADRAFITYDQPVRKIDDLGSRKVTTAELVTDAEAPTSDPRKGTIIITNNRSTVDPEDDVILRTPGPLYYLDEPKPAQPHLWTNQHVEIVDRQLRPLPSQPESQLQMPTLVGEGMRVYLIVEPPKPSAAPSKQPANSNVTGVERIEFDHNVFMNLWTASRNMVGGNDAAKTTEKPPDGKPADKVLLTVQTNGPFTYDMIKDLAHFEVPPKTDPSIQEYVKVVRHSKGKLEDTLTSDYLDVQFKSQQAKKDGPAAKSGAPAAKSGAPVKLPKDGTPTVAGPPSPPKTDAAPKAAVVGAAAPSKSNSAGGDNKKADPEKSMEIETIHAWGKNIALSSDEESLFAYGFDLVYDERIKQTVIKGAPMHAVKNGNLIRAPELLLANLDDEEKQHARARGPGIVGMGEFDPKTQEHSQQAHWQEWMVVTKVKEQGKNLDLITLTGQAKFIDTVSEQRLNAHEIKLWMIGKESEDKAKQPEQKAQTKQPEQKAQAKQPENKEAAKAKTATKKTDSAPKTKDEKEQPNKQAPHRLQAVGDVVLTSPDLIVYRCDYLNTWFKDLPPAPMPAPKAVEPNGSAVKPPDPPAKPVEVKKKDETIKKDPPLIVRHSRRIEAWVNRIDGKNEIDKIHNEGNVVIHQDPTPGNEKGVDVAGHTVDVQHFVEGDYLVVEGNEQVLGEVHFDKISIIGDDIRIDQRDNTTNVKGPGSMRMLSKSTLDGTELKTPTFIDIFWNDSMELQGAIRSIRYQGSVQAKQLDSKVLCEEMQVWLDRPIYLNQATKPKTAPAPVKKKDDDDSPKVERVTCVQTPSNGVKPKRLLPVFAEDSEKIGGSLVKYQNIVGREIEMDNVRNTMTTNGPGFVRIFQKGSQDPVGAPAPAAPAPAAPKKAAGNNGDEMKLTWVKFDQRMVGHNNEPKRAIFFEVCELVHMAAERHDVEIDITKLPADAMYLKCYKQLEVTTQSRKTRDKNGNEVEVKWQEMLAEGNVRVRSDDYDGWAGTVTYTEEKSLLVFTGTPKSPAVLNRAEVKGGERKTFRGKRITYNTKTKDFSVEESVGGSSQ